MDVKSVTRRSLALGLSAAGAAAPLWPAGAQRRPPSGEAQAPARKPPPLLGVYVGNEPRDVLRFERWLGREVDGVLGYTGGSWDEIRDPKWFIDLWSQIDRPVFWSYPLLSEDSGTLEDVANGRRNAYFRQGAQMLASFRPQDEHIYVRTGWEFNGDWFPWTGINRERAFIGAFRRFVDNFRAVSNRFRFEWNVNLGGGQVDPERCYPGDAHVDIIGMDFYFNPEYNGTDPVAAWDWMLKEERGLRWHQEFAASRRKPTAYSEWGVTTNNAGPFLERAKAWFDSHDVVYQTYWNSNASFQGKLSDGKFPRSANAYSRLFSRDPPRRQIARGRNGGATP
jgi:Glycosyl hydrolase family 26